MVRANAKMHGTTFCRFRRLLSKIDKIVLSELDLLFESKKCEMLTSLKRLELAWMCMGRLLQILTFPIEWRHYDNCTPWPWPAFLTSNIWNVETLISLKRWEVVQKCVIRLLYILYLPSNDTTAKVLLRNRYQGKLFVTLISQKRRRYNLSNGDVNLSETVRANVKINRTTFIDLPTNDTIV